MFPKMRLWNWNDGRFIFNPKINLIKNNYDGEGYLYSNILPAKIDINLCTGLKDINEKDVYWGDIVKFKDVMHKFDSNGVVNFANASFFIQSGIMHHYRWIDYELEVIGNIYEDEKLAYNILN